MALIQPQTLQGKISLLLLALLLSFVLYAVWHSSAPTTIYIGMVVPKLSSPEGKTMVRSGELALKAINAKLQGRSIKCKLKVVEDRNNPAHARKMAQELAQFGVAVTLGSSAASEYQKQALAMISPSSTSTAFLRHNPWAFSTMTSAALQGNFLLHFLQSTTERNGIYILEDNSPGSDELTQSMMKTAKALAIPVLQRWSVDAKEATSERQIDAILDTIRQDPMQEKHALLVATNVARGVQMISSLKRIGHRLMILAPHNFADHAFLDAVNSYPQERVQPGYYSDGLYVVTPYLSQAGLTNQVAIKFQQQYQDRYHQSPGWLAAAWYDAMLAAGGAITRLDDKQIKKKTINQLREEIRDKLQAMYAHERGVEGVNGRIYFNPQGEAFRSLAVGFYSKQRLIPADYQYQPLIYPEREQHVLQDVLQGDIFIGLDGQLFRKTRIVYTGIDFTRISNLNLLDSSFDADFYLWFRYRGTFDDPSIEFLNTSEPVSLGAAISTDKRNGMTTRAYRVQGTFRSPFDFHDYPFDHQQLKVAFKHQHAQKKDLLYVTDIQGLRQGVADQEKTSLRLGGWSVRPTVYFQEIASTSSTLGIERFMEHGNLIEYSQFTSTIPLIRDSLNFVIKHLMTLVILLVVTYIVYYLPPNQMELAGGITMTSLLTAAVMHQELNASLPEVGYTVAIDYVFFISYIMMASSALYPLIQYNRFRAKLPLQALHRVGRFGYPLGVLSIIVTMYYLLHANV
ncbi:MAG: ABC transporter substrate-binding protein [Mariprofundales bacterium]